eukprot:SAG31_NODE_13519_length_864_cov_0.925490_2_plen_110_part_00
MRCFLAYLAGCAALLDLLKDNNFTLTQLWLRGNAPPDDELSPPILESSTPGDLSLGRVVLSVAELADQCMGLAVAPRTKESMIELKERQLKELQKAAKKNGKKRGKKKR